MRALPEWFGLEEPLLGYVEAAKTLPTLIASEAEEDVGFLTIKQHTAGSAEIQGKNEAATAAAITQSGGIELRGSKASATSKQAFDATSAQDKAAEQRNDPHGPAISLRNP